MSIDIEYIEKSIEEFRALQNEGKEEIIKLLEEKVPTYKRKQKLICELRRE